MEAPLLALKALILPTKLSTSILSSSILSSNNLDSSANVDNVLSSISNVAGAYEIGFSPDATASLPNNAYL